MLFAPLFTIPFHYVFIKSLYVFCSTVLWSILIMGLSNLPRYLPHCFIILFIIHMIIRRLFTLLFYHPFDYIYDLPMIFAPLFTTPFDYVFIKSLHAICSTVLSTLLITYMILLMLFTPLFIISFDYAYVMSPQAICSIYWSHLRVSDIRCLIDHRAMWSSALCSTVLIICRVFLYSLFFSVMGIHDLLYCPIVLIPSTSSYDHYFIMPRYA